LEFGSEDLPLLHRRGRSRVILSHHDLESTPTDLQEIRKLMESVGHGALLKIVTFADALTDNLRIRDLLQGGDPGTLIAFCMGSKGIPSRILAPSWGSAGIFAPLRGAPASAPGQIPLEDLFDRYHFESIGPKTRILGLLGSPVGHSISPAMHNAALAARGLDYRYLPFEASSMAEFLPLLSELPISGLSVTLPHKETIVPYLDEIDPIARAIGAVNTVVKSWNRMKGYNTDAEAAVAPLRRTMSLHGATVALLGAGGAARALLHGLTEAGAKVTIFNRTESRARSLATRFGARSRTWRSLEGHVCDVLINATSVGLAPQSDASPIPDKWVTASCVYDIVYNPPETLFLRRARARGARILTGVDMFVEQGAAQFRLFTGEEPPVETMRHAVLAALGGGGAAPGGGIARRKGAGRPPATGIRSRAGKRRRPTGGSLRKSKPVGRRRSSGKGGSPRRGGGRSRRGGG
ncbi:MAG: shikimate dehydrogenase, partial [Acidobacteria bacterium]|nr:shikimate dehydrogenase [Acidobacteriota bacterium]